MKTKMDHVQEALNKTKNKKQRLSEMETELQAAKEKAKSDIKNQVQQCFSKVKAQGDEMMELVDTNCQQNLTTLREKQNHTKDTVRQLENVHSTAQSVVDSMTDHNLMQQHASLVDQMDRLCLTQQSESEAPSLGLEYLEFIPGSGLQDMSWFGHMSTYGKNKCKLKLLSEICQFQKAVGVAKTKVGLLAVVDSWARNVSIYCKENVDFNRQYRIGLDPLRSSGNVTQPNAVAATSEGNFVISDDGVIKIFSPDGRYERSWPESVYASRITTTPDDMIVIVSEPKRVITVHQSNGKLIRTHQVDCGDIVDIASNGKQIAFTTGYGGKVCVIDFVTGHSLWTVNMVMPRVICCEQKSNTILIAGGSDKSGQDVIKQHCSTTGRLISRSASSLYAPWAMTTTHDSKLVVADEKTVKVYQIDYE